MSAEHHTQEIRYRTIDPLGRYRVGDDGSVWMWKRKLKLWKQLRGGVGIKGYRHVFISDGNGGAQCEYIHRLVLFAFSGACPENMQCRHLDGNPANNRIENLKWGTPKENADDKRRHGKPVAPYIHSKRSYSPSINVGEKNAQAKVTAEQVRHIRDMRLAGHHPKELARTFGLHVVSIYKILRHAKWKSVV